MQAPAIAHLPESGLLLVSIQTTGEDGTDVIVGPSTLTLVVTAAGETFADQDFTLAAVVIPPDPTDPIDPSTPPSAGGGQLPGTGLGPETFAWAAAGSAVLVFGVVLFLLARRRANRA